MNKMGYIVTMAGRDYFVNRIQQYGNEKTWLYQLEPLSETDWIKHYADKYDRSPYREAIRDAIMNRMSRVYRGRVGRFYQLGEQGKLTEI